jgi:hypothetical protein
MLRLIAAFTLAATSTLLLAASDGANYIGAGADTEMDCDGGPASVEGASNHITFRGGCSSLEITGAANIITIDLASNARISVTGASNEIYWTAPQGTRPKQDITGAGNRVVRAK